MRKYKFNTILKRLEKRYWENFYMNYSMFQIKREYLYSTILNTYVNSRNIDLYLQIKAIPGDQENLILNLIETKDKDNLKIAESILANCELKKDFHKKLPDFSDRWQTIKK